MRALCNVSLPDIIINSYIHHIFDKPIMARSIKITPTTYLGFMSSFFYFVQAITGINETICTKTGKMHEVLMPMSVDKESEGQHCKQGVLLTDWPDDAQHIDPAVDESSFGRECGVSWLPP